MMKPSPFLPLLFCLLALALPCPGADLHLAPHGGDVGGDVGGDGSAARPFATLERVRDEIRLRKQTNAFPDKGIVVHLAPGTYQRERSFELTAEDSGKAGAPVLYRGAADDRPRLTGGRVFSRADFAPVEDPFTTVGNVVQQGDVPRNWLPDRKAAPPGPNAYVPEDQRSDPPRGFAIQVDPALAKRWATASEAPLYGYWRFNWADQSVEIASIAPETGIIGSRQPSFYGVLQAQRFRIASSNPSP